MQYYFLLLVDQKVLCKPNLVENNRYQCLFMVVYDRQDVEYEQDLLVYARSVLTSMISKCAYS